MNSANEWIKNGNEGFVKALNEFKEEFGDNGGLEYFLSDDFLKELREEYDQEFVDKMHTYLSIMVLRCALKAQAKTLDECIAAFIESEYKVLNNESNN